MNRHLFGDRRALALSSIGWAVAVSVTWADPVFAAEAPPGATATTGGLEEVIVTAQKRAETEQSVPLSMTTFNAAALQQKEITEFFDYATKVPNLGFAMTGDGVGTARTISIRGISGDNVTGFYIDDTPLPDSIDPRILDVARIEVLRGPQGTLYGARSMGGTVRVSPRRRTSRVSPPTCTPGYRIPGTPTARTTSPMRW